MKWHFSRRMQVAAGVVAVLILLVPIDTKVTTDFVLEPGARAFVRAEAPGWVQAVKVEEGQEVAAGMLLGILRNPEIEARADILARRVASEERALAAAQSRGDIARFREHWQRREQLRVELAEAQARREKLVLRALLAGVVTTPRLAERTGQFLNEGATFCEVADRRTMRARVLVRDWDVEEIQVHDPVKLKVRARPWKSFGGRVEAISPAAAPDLPLGAATLPERGGVSLYNYFAVELRFPNPRAGNAREELREGMTGTAKIYGSAARISGWGLPLAVRAVRSLWRWARRQVW
mgnify:CR=1 FL=1